MKKCTKCLKTKPLSNFNKRTISKDGLGTRCKVCVNKECYHYARNNREKRTAYFKKYRRTLSGKNATSKATRNYNNKNPEKRGVWNKAKQLPDSPCEVCDNPKTDKHHPDYSKPLEVVYLCRLHHKQRHVKL